MRPEFAAKLDGRQEARITDIVKRLTKVLDSDEIVGNDQTTPRRNYGRFLDQILTSCLSERQKKSTQKRESPCVSKSSHGVVFPVTPTSSPPLTQPTIPEIKMNDAFVLPQMESSFMQPWDMMDMSSQMAGNISSFLSFSDNQLPPGFLSWPDHSWFNQS